MRRRFTKRGTRKLQLPILSPNREMSGDLARAPRGCRTRARRKTAASQESEVQIGIGIVTETRNGNVIEIGTETGTGNAIANVIESGKMTVDVANVDRILQDAIEAGTETGTAVKGAGQDCVEIDLDPAPGTTTVDNGVAHGRGTIVSGEADPGDASEVDRGSNHPGATGAALESGPRGETGVVTNEDELDHALACEPIAAKRVLAGPAVTGAAPVREGSAVDHEIVAGAVPTTTTLDQTRAWPHGDEVVMTGPAVGIRSETRRTGTRKIGRAIGEAVRDLSRALPRSRSSRLRTSWRSGSSRRSRSVRERRRHIWRRRKMRGRKDYPFRVSMTRRAAVRPSIRAWRGMNRVLTLLLVKAGMIGIGADLEATVATGHDIEIERGIGIVETGSESVSESGIGIVVIESGTAAATEIRIGSGIGNVTENERGTEIGTEKGIGIGGAGGIAVYRPVGTDAIGAELAERAQLIKYMGGIWGLCV